MKRVIIWTAVVVVLGLIIAAVAIPSLMKSKLSAVDDARDMPAAPAPARASLAAQRAAAGDEAPPAGQAAEWNTEDYDRIVENPFLAVLQNPLSTFSIDVDTAAYANARRFLNDGSLPPADAVRIEEFINYFKYDYSGPEGDRPFSVATEISDCPWNDAHRLALIGLQGRTMAANAAPPCNLVFLLDVSGSMDDPRKLPLLKKAFRLLTEQLRDNDRVAIAVYAGAEGLALPSTPGSDKRAILAALDRLQAGGTTAGAAGITLAYQQAKEHFIAGGNNRVILASDGDFNVGMSSDAALVDLIEAKRKEGIFLSVLGFGTGNVKDNKMEKLADHGNGNYSYIDSILEAQKVLVNQMAGTLFTIAKDVKLQVEFNPAKVKAYRLIGYENRMLRSEDFNDDTKDAGEMGAGHTVTALYEIIPAGSAEAVPGVDPLKYQAAPALAVAAGGTELFTVKLRYKRPDAETSELIERPVEDRHTGLAATSANYRWAASAAGFGLLLRNSQFKGGLTWDGLLGLAQGAVGTDPNGYRAECIGLIQKAKALTSVAR